MLTKLGKYLRTLRIQNEETLADMASKLNISVSYLSYLERGKRKPPEDLIDKVLATYEISNDRELQEAYLKSIDEVKINISDSTIPKQQLSLAFSRKVDGLSPLQISKIMEVLGEDDE